METKLMILPPPPPIELVRTFRCNNVPLSSFLQDFLVDMSSRVCCRHLLRLRDILKHIQFTVDEAEFDEGKLWFILRDILKKDYLSNDETFRDGRYIRFLVLTKLQLYKKKHNLEFSMFSPRAKKIDSYSTPYVGLQPNQ